jgi:hypothetical protein
MGMSVNGDASERLFAELCSKFFLNGFVFHSPKYKHVKGEDEVGDVVIWVGDVIIAFEIVWKSPEIFSSQKSFEIKKKTPGEEFVKRIGEKRDQLVRDYHYYNDSSKQIKMRNENAEEIIFSHQTFNFESIAFCGIVIIDTEIDLAKLHYKTMEKSLEQEFAIAIMTKTDFLNLLDEVDTPMDLFYYLGDRTKFLKAVFKDNAHIFLSLNMRYEQNLIGFYKLNNSTFPVENWRKDKTKEFWTEYKESYADYIKIRNEENNGSSLIDKLIDDLRNRNTSEDSTLLHSWELATLTRRFRAVLAKKIEEVIDRLIKKGKESYFAFFNQVTKCWLLFYFREDNDPKVFREKARFLTCMKMLVERKQNNFAHSVFCYAFRKSPIITSNEFNDVFLRIDDANNYSSVSQKEYALAASYFAGKTEQIKIIEFPSKNEDL